MRDLAQYLLLASVGLPLVGVICGLLSMRQRPASAATFCATAGVFGAFVAAASLAVVLRLEGRENVAVVLGTWLRTTSSRTQQIDCGLQADPLAAIALAVMAGLMWLTVRIPSRSDGEGPLKIAMSVILFGINGLVASSSLVPMFACWLIVSAGTLMMSVWSSAPAAVPAMRRMLAVGLVGDLILLWVVMLIGLAGGSNSFVEIRWTALGRLATGNPAWPELISSLIVLSSLSRCGMFPFFGWNGQAANWETRTCIAIYAIGYVPSGVWMLLKCQPLLATSETALSMLSGFGLLGAILGAFVACAQPHLHQRIGFLVGSQVGFLLVALSSGGSGAVALGVWHHAVIASATFLLFVAAGNQTAPRPAAIAGVAGAMAMAGLFPLGGWTHHNLVEMTTLPRVVTVIDVPRPEGVADATQTANTAPDAVEESSSNQPWRTWGLIAAQALSAFAVARGLAEFDRQRRAIRSTDAANSSVKSDFGVVAGVLLLLVAGPFGGRLGIVAIPEKPDEWIRLGVAVSVVLLGLGMGWRSARSATTVGIRSNWETLARLSREQLYLEQSFRQLFEKPVQLVGWLSLQSLNAASSGQAWRTLILQSISRLGIYVEGLQVSRADFYIATILLGTATLLLTLFLVV